METPSWGRQVGDVCIRRTTRSVFWGGMLHADSELATGAHNVHAIRTPAVAITEAAVSIASRRWSSPWPVRSYTRTGRSAPVQRVCAYAVAVTRQMATVPIPWRSPERTAASNREAGDGEDEATASFSPPIPLRPAWMEKA